LRGESGQLLDALIEAWSRDPAGDVTGTAWQAVRQNLEELSRSRAADGYSPSETATFVFSFKQPLFDVLRDGGLGEALPARMWDATTVIDGLGLITVEAYQRSRE
jgi:rsbT co-antagonist protein RsbR